jgi:hypothetical protein
MPTLTPHRSNPVKADKNMKVFAAEIEKRV